VSLPITMAIGQMLVAGVGGTQITPGLRHLILDDKVGGVILFASNFGGTAVGLQSWSRQLQELGKQAGLPAPMLITTDQEGGQISSVTSGITQLPSEHDLGMRGAAAATEQVREMAAGLAASGVDIDLAPVADLRTNPQDAVIGARSFGPDVSVVGPLVAAYVAGLHRGGVASTLKHFPGLGGAPGNPHFAITADPVDMATWVRTSAQSFAAGIAAGTDAVMTTAVRVPGLDPSGRPAMLSRAVVTGLLRQKLGFHGVIVTDSLALGGLQAIEPIPQSIVDAARAGNDLLLMSDSDTTLEDHAVMALRSAVDAGIVVAAEVQASAQRVIALRMRYAGQTQAADRQDPAVAGVVRTQRLLAEPVLMAPLRGSQPSTQRRSETTSAPRASVIAITSRRQGWPRRHRESLRARSSPGK
jgi:beta-N-acetylhexosaminidase